MKRLLLLLALPLLTGCAGLEFDDYGRYADTLKAHSESEAIRIADQAKAISTTVANAQGTQSEKAMLAVIGALLIRDLKPTELNMERPHTGFSVLNNLVEKGPVLAGFAGMGFVAYEGLKHAGKNITQSADTINNSESFNPLEVHSTGSDNSPVSVPFRTTESTTYVPVQ